MKERISTQIFLTGIGLTSVIVGTNIGESAGVVIYGCGVVIIICAWIISVAMFKQQASN